MPAWIDALKKWNAGRDRWTIPRKGTDEYEEVRKLMSNRDSRSEAKEILRTERRNKIVDSCARKDAKFVARYRKKYGELFTEKELAKKAEKLDRREREIADRIVELSKRGNLKLE